MEKPITREQGEHQMHRILESAEEAKTFSDIAKVLIDHAGKYVLTDSDSNLACRQEAEKRLSLMLEYCCLNEQPVASYILLRILKESETNKDLMNTFQYDYSNEFERSVNEVLCACLNYYVDLGNVLWGEEVMDNVD